MGGNDHTDVEHRLARELNALLVDRDLWVGIESPHREASGREAMARRALALYDLTSPILEVRVEDFAEPVDHAVGVLRDIADACAVFSRRWSDAERTNLIVPDRSEVEAIVSLYDLAEWAASMDVHLPLAEPGRAEGPLKSEVPGNSHKASSEEVAAAWSRTVGAFRQVAALRATDQGRAGIQGDEARDAASGLVALGRVCLVSARQSSQAEAIAVGVTQLLAAQGVFVASWETDKRSELFPNDAYLRKVLKSTGAVEWLADHATEVPSWLSM